MSSVKNDWKIACFPDIGARTDVVNWARRHFPKAHIVSFWLRNPVDADSDEVYKLEVSNTSPFEFGKLLAEFTKAENYDLFVFPATYEGKVAAGVLAAALGLGAVSDVEFVKEELYYKSVADNLVGMKILSSRAVITVSGWLELVKEASGDFSTKVLEVKEDVLNREFQKIKGKGRLIIGIGGGVSKSAMPLVLRLAELLGADIVGTRVAFDRGLIDKSRYVGQTGISINGDIYLALGISGAAQHMIGVPKRMKIIAVNVDEKAPIAALSDYFVKERAEDFVRAMVDMLEGKA